MWVHVLVGACACKVSDFLTFCVVCSEMECLAETASVASAMLPPCRCCPSPGHLHHYLRHLARHSVAACPYACLTSGWAALAFQHVSITQEKQDLDCKQICQLKHQASCILTANPAWNDLTGSYAAVLAHPKAPNDFSINMIESKQSLWLHGAASLFCFSGCVDWQITEITENNKGAT